jgi:thiol-disulfide isomerase/thioredoxin
MLLMAVNVKGQGLHVGDVVPDVRVERIYGFERTQAYLYELLNNKPAIIIFWTSTCGTCRKYLGEVETLQREYGDRIQFMLVTSDKLPLFETFRKKHPVAARLRVPSAAADTNLRKLFQYLMVPHIAWISADKKIQAITGKDEVNAGNLERLVSGTAVGVTEKKDPSSKTAFLARDPIMLYNYESTKGSIYQYSYLSGYRGDIAAKASREKDKDGGVRLMVGNYSVDAMYQWTYPQLYPFHRSQLLFPDSADYRVDYKRKTGLYCYDLVLRDVDIDSAYRHMRKDMDQFFGLTSSVTRKEIACYVLRRTGTEDKLASKADKVRAVVADGKQVISKYTIPGLIQFHLNDLPLKVIDETNYRGKIDIVLPENISDVPLLNSYLDLYGLELIKAERKLEVLVLERRR